jgi:lipopolysaccharide biosynthesis regulator YciM
MNLAWHDLLWLLLPLAAASGWYAARREQRRSRSTPAQRFSSDYFRGVNFLLNEQPDKAIEVFTQMVEVNTETVETHLALGSLFRRRGEVERAIRIHQNLIARPSLDAPQRALALCELALDYQKAGLLDRAENLFLELTEVGEHAEQALRSLMHIYEQEKEWEKAVATGRRLAERFGRPLAPVLAQYHCEMAERKIQYGETEQAKRLLHDAVKLDPRCARASLILGRMAASAGQYREAIAIWQRIEDQDPTLLGDIIYDLTEAFRALNDEPGLRRYLEQLALAHTSPRLFQALSRLVDTHDGSDAALSLVAERVRQHPSLQGLSELLGLLGRNEGAEPRREIDLVREVLARLAGRESGYLCQQCGFQGQALHWQCPACYEWLTMKPIAIPSNRDTVIPWSAVKGRSGSTSRKMRRK